MTCKFSELEGRTLTDVKISKATGRNRNYDSDCIDFLTDDGARYRLTHLQDCCENVYLEDVTGDVKDLIGSRVELAEEKCDEYHCDDDGNARWTFYRLRTIKGDVTFRFHGSSNGYYSVGVNFFEVKNDN